MTETHGKLLPPNKEAEFLEKLKEYCAVTAWMTGIELSIANQGGHVGAARLGSLIAERIRNIKIEQFQAEQEANNENN